jgi:RHS repeat-associated protein
MTISGSSPTTYSYYANGWLKSVSGGGVPDLTTYSYDEVGNRTGIDYDSGTVTTYQYDNDPRYRISEIAHDPVYGDTLTIDYGSRDGVGNPTEIESVGYDYDANNRLIEAGATTYTYDWVGNRVTPGSMVYDYADELTSWPGQHTYDYLGTGSLYEQKDSTGQTTQKTYTYTAANLLESVTHNSVQGEPVSSMEWDADSNRVSFTSSEGGTWEYVYDITAGIPAVIKETGGAYPKTYLREPDGSLIAMFVESYPYYYHFDALGSTRMLTDETGHITDSYTYDAWGNLTNHTGDTSQPYQFVGELGYYTHYQDENLPLLQLGVRFDNPQIGRFTQRDRIKSYMVADYVYASDRPIRRTDPLGLQDDEEGNVFEPPILQPDKNCVGLANQYKTFYKYAKGIAMKLELNCPYKLPLHCHKFCKVNEWCHYGGSGTKHGIHIYYPCNIGSNPVYPYCMMLHEMIHACGKLGHAWMDDLAVPGCHSKIL